MSRKAVSMRGEVVDFDLFAIKELLNGAPATETIENRERFIALKRKRGTKRKIQDMLSEQDTARAAVDEALAAKASQPKSAPAKETTAADEPQEETETTTRRRITKKDS